MPENEQINQDNQWIVSFLVIIFIIILVKLGSNNHY